MIILDTAYKTNIPIHKQVVKVPLSNSRVHSVPLSVLHLAVVHIQVQQYEKLTADAEKLYSHEVMEDKHLLVQLLQYNCTKKWLL